MGISETVKCAGSNLMTSTIQFLCISILETLLHVTSTIQFLCISITETLLHVKLKRQAEISVFQYFLQEFDNNCRYYYPSFCVTFKTLKKYHRLSQKHVLNDIPGILKMCPVIEQ